MPTFGDRLAAALIVWFLSLLALIPTVIGGGIGAYAVLGVLMSAGPGGRSDAALLVVYGSAVAGFFAWLLLKMASQTVALKAIGELSLKSTVTACTLGYMIFGVIASQAMTRSFGSRYSHWLLLTLVSPFALAGTYWNWPFANSPRMVVIIAGIGAIITAVVIGLIYS